MQALFLGPLSAIEAGKLSERMLKFLMLKLVFIAAVSGPGMPAMSWRISSKGRPEEDIASRLFAKF